MKKNFLIVMVLLNLAFPTEWIDTMMWSDTAFVSKFYVNRGDNTFNGDAFIADLMGYPPIFGREIRVIVNGMRCPDMITDRVQAERSRFWLVKYLVQADTIRLVNMKRGDEFEIIADVFIDDMMLRYLMFYFTKCEGDPGRRH